MYRQATGSWGRLSCTWAAAMLAAAAAAAADCSGAAVHASCCGKCNVVVTFHH